MGWWESLLLGILQGLTEFLPVSSSGHLELAKVILGVSPTESLQFTVMLHGATVLSTICALWPELVKIFKGFFQFKNNEELHYVLKLLVSMVPIGLVGLFAKDWVEQAFDGNILLVGEMLLLTAVLLALSSRFASRPGGPVTYKSAIFMGLGQALAVLPGLSRSGTTISVGLLSDVDSKQAAQFSFLMVLPPILGENLLDLMKGDFGDMGVSPLVLIVGFLAAFITGYLACRVMISFVRRKGMRIFAIYCAIVGLVAICCHLFL